MINLTQLKRPTIIIINLHDIKKNITEKGGKPNEVGYFRYSMEEEILTY